MTDDQQARPGSGQRRPWIPDVIGNRYEIDRELGSGAAAVTVVAQDRRLGRQVAIKILKPESETDPEFARRFTREARAAASINHPNVVSVYDVGEEEGLLFLVMQFVDGTDLKRVIEREGALPWTRAVEIARAVLAGLAPIHDIGIVHRDIKPQNVLIGNDGEVKVTDFGVAHVDMDAQLTTAGTTVGTVSYMAPEQAQGQNPTPAADVYAVGVMLYEMVTGRLPFAELTSIATMLAHIQQAPRPPVAPTGMERLPEGLTLVIQQAMAKDPAARFRSATAMRRALEHPASYGRAPANQGTRTEVVPSVRGDQRAAPRRRAILPPPSATGPRYRSETEPRKGGGFGTPFVMILLVLALGLATTAGVLWYLEQQPDDDPSNQVSVPTSTVAVPTPTPTMESEQPGVIEPIDEEEEPTPTPTPTPEPTSTPTPTPEPTPTPTPTPEPEEPSPTPTEVIIVPVDNTPVSPSTDADEAQIIEPIVDSTVPDDAQN